MGDKSLFRTTADSITNSVTQWVDESAERHRKEVARQEERQKILGGTLIESVRDTARDFKEGIAAYASTVGTNKSFLYEYNVRSGRFEEAFRENVSKKLGYEKFGFKMAAGWELPKGVPFNGKLDPEKEGKKIDGLTAVFLRGKDGKIEALDYHDSRYADLVVPYLVTQLIVPSMATKAFGALSLVAKGTKAAEIVTKTSQVAGKVWSAADNGSGLGLGAMQMSSNFMLKPAAIGYLARMYDNPKDMTNDKLREMINEAFGEFSYKNGPLGEQYYVPPIGAKENPSARLDDLGRGSLKGIYKVSHPFEKVGPQHFKADENLTDVRNAIRDDIYFQRGYLRLTDRALSGAKLSPEEKTLLSFGTRAFTGNAADPVTPENLPRMLGITMGIDRDPQETDAQYLGKIKGGVSDYLKVSEKIVQEHEAFQRSKAMANNMAFAIH